NEARNPVCGGARPPRGRNRVPHHARALPQGPRGFWSEHRDSPPGARRFQNLSSFPSQLQILHPLEKNAGAPGTVTKAEVEFQPHGNMYIPVWKATVE